jgi:hypothetical protein
MFEQYTADIFPEDAVVKPNDRHGRVEPELIVPGGTVRSGRRCQTMAPSFLPMAHIDGWPRHA